MKRLLFASALALLLHGVFLGLRLGDQEVAPPSLPHAQRIQVSLASRPLPEPPRQEAEEEPPPPPQVVEPAPHHPPPVEEKPVEKKEEQPVRKLVPRITKKVPQLVEAPDSEPENPPRPEPEPMTEPLAPPPPEPVVEETPSRPVPEQNQPVVQAATKAPKSAPPARAEEVRVVTEAVPLYRKNPPPVYPRAARRRGMEGEVILKVLVNEKGRVEELELVSSSGHRVLDRSALAAVRRWSFTPGRRGDEAISMWVTVPVRFVIDRR